MNIEVEILVKDVGILEIPTDVSDEFGIPLIFNINDISDISKRKASFSKTIKVLGTKQNNLIFDQLYEIKGQNFTYKMNRKKQCSLLVNKNPVIDGYMVLNSISKLLIGSRYEIVYDVNIFDEVKNLFDDLAGKKLSDLDFSSGFTFQDITYSKGDHILNENNIVSTINNGNTYTDVYTYPLVDYGYEMTNNRVFPYNAVSAGVLFPAVFQKPIWDKIFYDTNTDEFGNITSSGFTYESTYLDGDDFAGFFTSLVSVYNKQNEFRDVNLCEYTSDGGFTVIGANFGDEEIIELGKNACSMNSLYTQYYELDDYYYSYDPIYGPRAEEEGSYYIKLRIDVAEDEGGLNERRVPGILCGDDSEYKIYRWDSVEDEGVLVKTITSEEMRIDITGQTSWYYEEQVEVTDVNDTDVFYFSITPGTFGWDDDGNCNEQDIDVSVNGCSLELIRIKNIDESISGKTNIDIKINDIIPDMSQVEFIKNHINMANLYVWSRNEDPKKLFIETRDTFYKNGTLIDWTDKIDYSKSVNIKSITKLISSEISLTYTEGDDFYSQQYKNLYDEIYGEKEIDLNNSTLKERSQIILDWQSYLLKNNDRFGITIPKLYDPDNSEQSWFDDRIEFKPLIGFNQNKNIVFPFTNTLKFGNSSGSTLRNVYLQKVNWTSHVSNLGGKLFDLNFETNNPTFTFDDFTNDRGLYKLFWENYLNNITDDDSRIVEYYINLDLNDILKLDFRDRILIDGQVFYLQKVEYDPTTISSSKVILLKELDPIEEGGFSIDYLLKNDTGDYITTSSPSAGSGDKIIIN